MRHWFHVGLFILIASCDQACPSKAGGDCDPRKASCPPGYSCALAEMCTRTCEQTSDCWVKVEEGCYTDQFPGQLQPDGGAYMEPGEGGGFCPDTEAMECLDGYCQPFECPRGERNAEGRCDYDMYGPSPHKGTRTQGPEE